MASASKFLTIVFLLTATAMIGCQNDHAAASGSEKNEAEPTEPNVEVEQVIIGGQEFELELATDDAERGRGLGGRDTLAEDGGMLFIFPEAKFQSFWMYDTRIPLDLLYLDARGWIVTIHENMAVVPPRRREKKLQQYQQRLRRYQSSQPAQFVIELPAGTVQQLGLETGEKIDLDLDRLKKLAE